MKHGEFRAQAPRRKVSQRLISTPSLKSLFFILAYCALTQSAAAQTLSQPQVQLTAQIIEQTYCSVNAEAITLQLKIKLRYTNLSSHPVILYKGHDLFFQTKIRSEPDRAGHSYQAHLLNMHYFDEEFERIDARAPGKVFVTLAPNQSFERELSKGIGVTDHSKERTSTSVHPGGHVLQLIVSTWYQSPKLAEQLRQQWRRKGFLWSQPLTSVPVKVDIQKPAGPQPCR